METNSNTEETRAEEIANGILAHNHKPHFGRRVEGCPKCDSLPPLEQPAKSTGGEFSYEQVQELLRLQAESLKAFAAELKAPDPEVAEANAKEKARKAEARERRIAEIRIEEEQKRLRQETCPHMKENGKSAIYRGQLFSDGLFHPMCHHCGKEFETVKPTAGDLTGAA